MNVFEKIYNKTDVRQFNTMIKTCSINDNDTFILDCF